MKKVYVIYQTTENNETSIEGIVSNKDVAIRLAEIRGWSYSEQTLDDRYPASLVSVKS